MRPLPVTIAEVEYTAFSLAEKLMTWNEPIPEFGSRFPGVLESCLAVPFASFGKKDLYRGLVNKSSILFYLLIKNHPFRNGNKRIAVMCLLYFLYKNGKWIYISNERLYRFAKHIAGSRPHKRAPIIKNIEAFLTANIKAWR
ncbi:MAG: type II toxin-antitoxin system death-on-curing family toxin [Candidatus Azambacteria bacterium]|nr:type II toxin-antitoxin system death-on-curing family toxin [Candidatus Azambacteria bacterium]